MERDEVMKLGYEFVKNSGLFFGDEFVAEFCPEVTGIREYYFLDSGEHKRIFLVKVIRLDGSETDTKEVDKLNIVSYFNLWNIPDCDLSGHQKRRLTHKMQLDSSGIKAESIVVGQQGLYSYEHARVYFWGNQIISDGDLNNKWEIQRGSEMALINMRVAGSTATLIQDYINLLPGVSEVIFYGSLFAVLKPFLCQWGYKPDFAISVVGPSGHLKTSLVRKYALWLESREEQEVSFRDYKRMTEIISMIDRIPGQNFLADDLHEAISGNATVRQSERLDNLVRHIGQHINCANVIITGETMKKMGIFSCMDRILQIKVPKMSSEELKELKNKMNQLQDSFMVYLAGEFLSRLMKNYDNVQRFVQEYWDHNCFKGDANFDTRTHHQGMFIKLTEEVFCKYMCGSLPEASGREKLHMALEKNYQSQQRELQWKRQEECDRDIVIDVYEMLHAHDQYVKIFTVRDMYCPSNETCLLDNGKIFIRGDALVKGMYEYYKRTVSLKKVTDALKQAGILEEDTDARTKKFMGRRHYVLSVTMMKNYVKWRQECE